MTNGIAHVSFSGSGIFLPARSPYDRQVLEEHVLSWARTQGQVQVLVDKQRWMVRRRGPRTACAWCGHAADAVCYVVPGSGTPYCVRCAFGDRGVRAPLQPVATWRAI